MPSDIVILAIMEAASEPKAAIYRRFFRTGPGQYGEGDQFAGVTVPEIRKIERRFRRILDSKSAFAMLQHDVHEVRLCALVYLVNRYRLAGSVEKNSIFSDYLAHSHRVNNWDLVDVSAPGIVGAHLLEKDWTILRGLAQSQLLWDRRIAMVSTLQFIRNHRLDPTYELCGLLLSDSHDLMHKACGWMLREAGKRDPDRLLRFLQTHGDRMARVQLRYAIEKFEPAQRAALLKNSRKRNLPEGILESGES